MLLLPVLLFCFPAAVEAEGHEYRIEELARLALEAERETASARFDLEEAEFLYRSRFGIFTPSVTTGTSLSQKNYIPETGPVTADLSGTLAFSLSPEKIFTLSGRELALLEEKQKFAELTVSLQYRMIEAAQRLLLLQEQTSLSRRQLETAEKQVDLAMMDWEDGRISRYDLLSARISYQEKLPVHQGLLLELQQQKERVARLAGIPAEEAENVKVLPPEQREIPLLPPGEKLQQLIEESREIVELRLSEERIHHSLKERKSRFLPAASASISHSLSVPLETGEPVQQTPLSWSLSVSVDLSDMLPWSDYRSGNRALEMELEKTIYERARQKEEMESQAGYLSRKIEQSAMSLENAETRVELAEQFLSITEEEFEAGRKQLLELEDARIKLAEAELNLLSRRYDRLSYIMELRKYLGLPPF